MQSACKLLTILGMSERTFKTAIRRSGISAEVDIVLSGRPVLPSHLHTHIQASSLELMLLPEESFVGF